MSTLDIHLIIILLFFLDKRVQCSQVNIATGKPATQSTTIGPYVASRGNDGNKGERDMESCTHTATYETTAWWRVDLQNKYTVSNVVITPRKNVAIGAGRLAGYSVYVSNETYSAFDSTTPQLCCSQRQEGGLPDIYHQQSPCGTLINGRYVTIYNERDPDQTYPPTWNQYAVLTLCEVEVVVQECPQNCKNCPCSTCVLGWYGQKCESSCSNCGNGSCIKDNGHCTSQTCRVKFHGDKCDLPCSDTCGGDGSCDKETAVCPSCKDGYYGDKCKTFCSNCASESCYKENGNCKSQSCKVGFYGLKCTDACSEQCASTTCNFNSGYCDRCDDNKFGIACDEICPLKCISCYNSSSCHECNTGWYGSSCQSNCSNCGGNGKCHKTSGLCVSSSCEDGYFNRYCSAMCSQNCTGDGSCEFMTGQCSSCHDGMFGTSCQNKCIEGCKVCNNTSICIECNQKLYGTQCNKNCPACGGNGACTIASGICISDSCETGYYGGGGSCDKICPTKCAGDGSCQKDSGDCLQGCVQGFTGFRCNQICPANCGGDGSCNKQSGNCIQGCNPGWFSARCNEKCPSNCGGDNSCNVDNGTCSQGCKPGWQGANCNKECDKGWYGKDCFDECGHCRNNSCDHINGTCKEGCQEGWSSAMCNVAVLKQESDNGMIAAAAGGAGGACILIIIISVIVVLVIRRRKQETAKRENTYISTMFKDNSASDYTGLKCDKRQESIVPGSSKGEAGTETNTTLYQNSLFKIDSGNAYYETVETSGSDPYSIYNDRKELPQRGINVKKCEQTYVPAGVIEGMSQNEKKSFSNGQHPSPNVVEQPTYMNTNLK